jgi:hypothetical protein
VWSGTIFDYSVKDAPAMTSFGDVSLQALMLAWCEEAPPGSGDGPIGIMNNAIRVNGDPTCTQPERLQDSSNSNPETTIDTPALSPGPGGSKIYVAWTAGNDPGYHLNIMSTQNTLANWGSKQVLNESSHSGPALAYAPPLPGHTQGVLFLAWTGTDGRINIRRSYDGQNWNDSDKIVLQQWAIDSPGIAYFYPNLYLFWRGTIGDQIWVSMSSDLGNTFHSQVMIPNQSTDYTPGLTLAGNDLILAWRGTDTAHQINVMSTDTTSSSDPLQSFGNQIVFTDNSNGAVSLATYLGQAYIGWGGTDPNHLLSIMPVVFQT